MTTRELRTGVMYADELPPTIPAGMTVREYRQRRQHARERKAFRVTLLIGLAANALAAVRAVQFYAREPNGGQPR